MKKIIILAIFQLITLFVFSQIKVTNLPSTTTGVIGDYLIKDDAAGIAGSTKKITCANFISTYSIATTLNTWKNTGNSGTTAATNFLGTIDNVSLRFRTNNTQRVVIDSSSGALGIGGLLNANKAFGDEPHLFEVINDGTKNVLRFSTYGDGLGGGGANNVHFVRMRGTISSPSATQSGDFFWSFGARGYDTSPTQSSSAFQCIADGNWTTLSHPSYIKFEVTPVGSIIRSEALRIASSGYLGVNTVNPTEQLHVTGNVRFSAALMPNNSAGSSGQILTSTGTGTAPVWQTAAAASGGTGITSYTVGDILYASGTTTLSKLADVATGNALISGGVSTAPSWGKIGLTTHVSGILPIANGGTNTTLSTGTGAIVYQTSPTINDATLGNNALLSSGGTLTMGSGASPTNIVMHANDVLELDGGSGAVISSDGTDINIVNPFGSTILNSGVTISVVPPLSMSAGVATGMELHAISTPTTASTITLTKNKFTAINPVGTIAALTINFPNSPNDNDFVEVKFDQVVTSVTYVAGTGGATINGQVNGALGLYVKWVYDNGTNTWY